MLLLSLLACTNVDDHAWSGGGSHYASGEMYSPADTSGGTDTSDTSGGGGGGSDTSDTALTVMSAVGTPACIFDDFPQIGIAIQCTSQWSATDAATLEGGAVFVNLLDADGQSVLNTALPISAMAGGDAGALLDETTVTLYLGDVDSDSAYTVYLSVENFEGTGQSPEYACPVSAM
jgi:hypothetical protein